MPLHKHDDFLSGTSANYLEALEDEYLNDADSVHPSMQRVFTEVEEKGGRESILNKTVRAVDADRVAQPRKVGVRQSLQYSRRLISMIQAYEREGHLFADLDPLENERERVPWQRQAKKMSLDYTAFGLTEEDLDKKFAVGFHDGVGGLFDANTPPLKLSDIVERLRTQYTGKIGYEFMHIYDEKVQQWLRERIECPDRVSDNPLGTELSVDDRANIYKNLAEAVEFENLLKTKFKTLKRFGSDGGESFIVGLKALIDRASSLGIDEVVMGMAHRGRLSTLHNVCRKPYEAILLEFEGLAESDVDRSWSGDYGDVKYHRGMRSRYNLRNGKEMSIELLSNPSHLETVNPVVQGYCKAAQMERGDTYGRRVLPIEVHGDAAIAGQGVIFETFGLAQIGKFNTGGTIHVVINNQIGFTTGPMMSRSSTHCSDVARVFQCPVFHVNGDSVEDVHRVFQLAADFRARFGKPVVIDLVCYRRFGHNESDTPNFTQPMLYKKIDGRKDVLQMYTEECEAEGTLPVDTMKELHTAVKKQFRGNWETYQKRTFDYADFQRHCIRNVWKPFITPVTEAVMPATGISAEQLAPVVRTLSYLPPEFSVHKTLAGILKKRVESLEKGTGIEWGTAEALAFGTLLDQGYPVRISGQDVERATFSQRHAVLHDQNSDKTYTQLEHVDPDQAPFTVTNSSLSEYGVMGFEVGYALRNPKALVIWEAQFADFANGAQIIFDQFWSSSECKWRMPSSLVVSLPHGQDGNGPEHSSGRIERFLQACTEDDALVELDPIERHHKINLEVVMPTTPKQYFHVLRRHMLRNFRKPMAIFFSKAFLRAPNTSDLSEITDGAFEPVLDDKNRNLVPKNEVRKLIIACGQVYHHIAAAIEKEGVKDVAVARLEQLAPFPLRELRVLMESYPNAELAYAQEEPKNMGAFSFVEPRVLRATNYERPLTFIGRLAGPAPATGYMPIHLHENKTIVEQALK